MLLLERPDVRHKSRVFVDEESEALAAVWPQRVRIESSAAALGGQESQAAGSAPARSEEAGAGATSSEGEGR